MEIKLYRVGGSVRDEILGIKSKDFDFSVEAPSFEHMKKYIVENGGTIYLEKPEFFTIRAKLKGTDADFVLCRKEGSYSDGRRPDSVSPGSIMDDLSRRDFTMNAIAIDVHSGDYFDPFNGRLDIQKKIIRCVGDARARFNEDSLRILRAIRFCLTKGFAFDSELENCLWEYNVVSGLKNISIERIREELLRCFKFNTFKTLALLNAYPLVYSYIFNDKNVLWLEPTLKE